MCEVWVLDSDGDIDLYTTKDGAIRAFREALEADGWLSEIEIDEAVEQIRTDGDFRYYQIYSMPVFD